MDLIWAVLATFLNYILGMILAIVINRKTTRIKDSGDSVLCSPLQFRSSFLFF